MLDLKKAFSKYTIQDWIFLVFSFLWVSIVILDYLNKQIIYLPSFTHFKYFGLFSILTVIGLTLSMSYCRIGPLKKFKALPVNGVGIFALFLLIICLVTMAYNQYWKASLGISNYAHLLWKALFTLGSAYLVVLAAYSIGNYCRRFFIKEVSNKFTAGLMDISLGLIIYHFGLLFLGVLGLLNQYAVLVLLAVLIGINFKSGLTFSRIVLWERIPRPTSLSFIGCLIAFFILVYVSLNYFYTQAPFPLGFDARNYYVNIARLLADAEGLIPGFQPYAWGLIMSTGYVAFNSPEVTLFLSVLGGLLSLFAIFHLANSYLKLSLTSSLLVVLLYLLTPTVTNHFIIEFKVDLALLFFQVTTIIVLLYWLFRTTDKKNLIESRDDWKFLAIIGIMLGFSLSIKVLSAFLIFGIFLGIWWFSKDIIGVIGLSGLAIGLILLTGFDNISGLRKYHLSPNVTGAALFILGLCCMVYSFIRSKRTFLDGVKALAFCGVFIVFTFSPWIYKNYHYTKSLSITKLLMGEKPRPKLNHDQLERNYNNLQNQRQSNQ